MPQMFPMWWSWFFLFFSGFYMIFMCQVFFFLIPSKSFESKKSDSVLNSKVFFEKGYSLSNFFYGM